MGDLLGRDEELVLVDEMIASARAGRGRALFVTGEAGIGKSAVLALARARGVAAGTRVLAGASWEADGAPPYWPWLQVLRAAADELGDAVRSVPGAARIATLVPEWGSPAPASSRSLEPDLELAAPDPAAARFGLLDAVARGLVALSSQAPLVILLDDLHAADLASIDLLVLLARELPRAAIALVGGWREGELAIRRDAAQQLARAGRHAAVRPLRRLTSDEVATWAARADAGADARALFARSEGVPLFVQEALRAGPASSTGGVAAAIRDHLALLSPSTRALLGSASVLGRELDRAAVRAIARASSAAPCPAGGASTPGARHEAPEVALEAADDAVAVALGEAVAAGVVEPRGDGWAFAHVLVRDHLYDALAPSRRAALHRVAGAAIDRADPSGTRAAHHLLAGVGADGLDLDVAVAAARAAAVRADALFAFEDAIALLAAAHQAIERAGHGGEAVALELLVELAGARLRAGQGPAGQADALRAAALARGRGAAELFARASLVYATELLDGRRDPQMIALLEEAARLLPPDDGVLRARVLARLGAALSPPLDPEDPRPAQVAAAAVDMARRLGDDEAIMFALRFRTHAVGYRADVREHLAVSQETVAFSDRIGRPLETLEQRTWRVGANLMLGELAAANAAADDLFALLDRLPQPHYRWRAPILRGALAAMRGDFTDAARQIAIARELATEHGLARAQGTAILARIGLAHASQSVELAAELVDDVRRITQPRPHSHGVLAWTLARAGRLDEARAALSEATFAPVVILSQLGAEAILLIGGSPHAERALDALTRSADLHPMIFAPSGAALLCPAAIPIGELHLLLGRPAEAIEWIERGLALARRIEARPAIARGTASLAAARDAIGGRGPHPGGMNVHSASAGRTTETGAASAGRTTPGTASGSRTLAIRRDGELVHVTFCGRTTIAPASKGLDYLERLVAAPGREIHVADLIGDDDRGDAGEVIDATARDEYRTRAEDLRAELARAHANNDTGRAERLAAELDAIAEQLAAGLGLGGRSRRAASRVERARINVQRRIRDAVRRLAGGDPALGRYLDATVQTGTFCSFTPLD